MRNEKLKKLKKARSCATKDSSLLFRMKAFPVCSRDYSPRNTSAILHITRAVEQTQISL